MDPTDPGCGGRDKVGKGVVCEGQDLWMLGQRRVRQRTGWRAFAHPVKRVMMLIQKWKFVNRLTNQMSAAGGTCSLIRKLKLRGEVGGIGDIGDGD